MKFCDEITSICVNLLFVAALKMLIDVPRL
jgi:hypothetical protein